MGRAGAADGGARHARQTRSVHVHAEAAPLKVFSRRPYTPNLRYLFSWNGNSPRAVARPEATTAALDGIGTTETTDMRGMGSPSEPLVARAARQHEK